MIVNIMGHFSMKSSSTQKSNSLLKIVLLSIIVIVTVGAIFFFLIPNLPTLGSNTQSSDQDINAATEAWNNKRYQDCLDICSGILDQEPHHFNALLLRGFSSYYLGESQKELESKTDLLMQSISDLRLNLILEPYRNNSDIQYILGKAYYGLGYFYHDISFQFFNLAKENGSNRTDILEYLGVLSSNMGDEDKAISYFKSALTDDNKEAIYLALASSYLKLENYVESGKNIEEILRSKIDPLIVQKARFIKGDILTREEKIDAAMEQYLLILEDDPNSADAHFYVGEMFSIKGDIVKARSEWRTAANLDPKHSGAINRLNTGM